MNTYSKTQSEIIEKTNAAIAELVYPKYDLLKAYNYYNGKRDADLFRYLEENFGIGNPTSIEFTPLIRKHIDALVGEFLGTPIKPKITCKDLNTISKITREKELEISKQVYEFLLARLQNKILSFLHKDGKDPLKDDSVQMEIDKLVDNVNQEFVSSFEAAAQDVLQYIIQSRHTDFLNNLKLLLTDLLITGYTFYKVSPSKGNQNIKIEVLDPLNTFIDRNPESPYIKDSYRAVVRRWMSRNQILNKYGLELTKEEVNDIKENWKENGSDNSYYYVRAKQDCGVPMTEGIRAGEEIAIPGYPESYNGKTFNYDLIPVYEVEWTEVDSKFIMHRRSVIRINEDVYIINDLDKDVMRSLDDPSYCTLSVNGVYFRNRNAEPYSLMLACMGLQDKYDVLCFYRDTLIASSGTVGYTLDISLLPKFLGTKLEDRILKHIAYKKGGVNLIDSSQDGRLSTGQAGMNTIFSDYDDTAPLHGIQAIQLAIQQVEETASSITGVFRERLNGIEQRDAVNNIKQGANNSFIITKQYYHQMDLVTNEMLLDCLNLAKKVFKNGLTGTLILGDKKVKVFTALPEQFTFTDYDIHIATTTDTLQELETLKQTLPQLVLSLMLSPDLLLEAFSAKSLSDLKNKVRVSMRKQEEKNDLIKLLSLQLQEALQQMLQLLNQCKEQENQLKLIDQQKLQLEQQKLKSQTDIDWYKAQTERQYKEATAEQDKKRTDIEIAQLHDGNPYNDKLREIK